MMKWKQQSPINLPPTVSATTPADYLELAWSKAIDGFLHQGPHGIEVLFGTDSDVFLRLEGKPFHLRNFHFHHPSEHCLNADAFHGELHLVHQNLSDLSYAVVGVFLSIDNSQSETDQMKELIQSFQRSHKSVSGPAKPIPLQPQSWLPPSYERLLRYEGSLTTEPFTESVTWLVLPDPKPISETLFAAIFGCHPQEARGLQSLDRRYILDLEVNIKLSK